ncbi:uncharacterized protein BDW43DRAFT_314558 [Aspergillus alliaceus]|uniref:uncharacterized protein n=1 Tax=Petromyces alliaceus TaxID=209559 RepID=UPI0012A4C32F|nr:uncharacterized protein BDW43DRAFT_314558 [Aspergillus alliaceus]KAB8229912.1 hypothetical protein BDW43DRAFT_314558 [Aspergillus alliaceus]
MKTSLLWSMTVFFFAASTALARPIADSAEALAEGTQIGEGWKRGDEIADGTQIAEGWKRDEIEDGTQIAEGW